MEGEKELNTDWYDKKHDGGETPSLEDSIELMKSVFDYLDISIPERTQRKIRDCLDQRLHELGKKEGYSPSNHVLAYRLLTSLGPLAGISRKDYEKYLKKYREVVEKQRNRSSFSENFS